MEIPQVLSGSENLQDLDQVGPAQKTVFLIFCLNAFNMFSCIFPETSVKMLQRVFLHVLTKRPITAHRVTVRYGEGGRANQNVTTLSSIVSDQKMLRVRDEEIGQSSSRGCGLLYRGAGHLTDEEEEEEGFSESELELYEQYKAAGFRDLVSNILHQSDVKEPLPVL